MTPQSGWDVAMVGSGTVCVLGFVPICFFVVNLILLGILVACTGATLLEPNKPTDPAEPPAPRPPYWVAAVVLAVCAMLLGLLSLVTDG